MRYTSFQTRTFIVVRESKKQKSDKSIFLLKYLNLEFHTLRFYQFLRKMSIGLKN